VRILRAGPDRDSAVHELRDDHVRFEGDMVDGRGKKCVFKNLIRFTKTLDNITFALFEEMDDIGSLEGARRHVPTPSDYSPRSGIE
jgi:hypothetical protein